MNRCRNHRTSTISSLDHAAALNRHHRAISGSTSVSSFQPAPMRQIIRAGIFHVTASSLTIMGATGCHRPHPLRCAGRTTMHASSSDAWSDPDSSQDLSSSSSSSSYSTPSRLIRGAGSTRQVGPPEADDTSSQSNPIAGWDSAQLALGGDLQTLIQV